MHVLYTVAAVASAFTLTQAVTVPANQTAWLTFPQTLLSNPKYTSETNKLNGFTYYWRQKCLQLVSRPFRCVGLRTHFPCSAVTKTGLAVSVAHDVCDAISDPATKTGAISEPFTSPIACTHIGSSMMSVTPLRQANSVEAYCYCCVKDKTGACYSSKNPYSKTSRELLFPCLRAYSAACIS